MPVDFRRLHEDRRADDDPHHHGGGLEQADGAVQRRASRCAFGKLAATSDSSRTAPGCVCIRRPSWWAARSRGFPPDKAPADQFSLRSSMSRCTRRTVSSNSTLVSTMPWQISSAPFRSFGEEDGRRAAIGFGIGLRQVENSRRCTRGCRAPNRRPAAARRRRRIHRAG